MQVNRSKVKKCWRCEQKTYIVFHDYSTCYQCVEDIKKIRRELIKLDEIKYPFKFLIEEMILERT